MLFEKRSGERQMRRQAVRASAANMTDDVIGAHTMVEVGGDAFGELALGALATAVVAMLAAGDQVRLVVAAALGVRLEVIERQLRTVLDGSTAPCAGESVAQVDGEALDGANPIHALPNTGVANCFLGCGFHVVPFWVECVSVLSNASGSRLARIGALLATFSV